ncbi:hypothetical protein [Nitratireductor sp. XY-223]|uniref:hypothetical protein n=1 Tax=Nitratireductor sp. XY-223 TaxID=2561926 RepID=UPI0010AAD8FC|nr:hypothetical protein [Nitratireductor sp. XY-223]
MIVSETSHERLTRDFLNCDIDAGTFRHRDHVAVAYHLLQQFDFVEATAQYARCLSTIATGAGAHTKFNTTITFAFMALIAERIHCGNHEGFDAFVNANPDLLERDALSRFYSPERLNCELARRAFLLPDRATTQDAP